MQQYRRRQFGLAAESNCCSFERRVFTPNKACRRFHAPPAFGAMAVANTPDIKRGILVDGNQKSLACKKRRLIVLICRGQRIKSLSCTPVTPSRMIFISTKPSPSISTLIVEGLAAESFIDYTGRVSFDSGETSSTSIGEMALPRISSSHQVPKDIRNRLKPLIAAE
ncbi:MAG: hypothetical protein P8Q99_15195 [Paracoccaceae bacterium]|nr:hypothetical protein [Paracoccaceae bacterium]